jgi:hypothetical protein
LPLLKRTAVFFNIGGGYYFTKCTLYDYQHTESHYYFPEESLEKFWAEHTYKVNGGNFGWHGGIGFEYSLGRNLSVIIEGQYRFIRIKELKGKGIRVTSEEDKEIIYGTLWYYKFEFEGECHTYLPFSDIKPESIDIPYTIRKAIFDLSGFSARIGIRIKLF